MQDDVKKISVLVPICNTEKYLRQCLDSIKNQTYENLEIICINDGSTDGSRAIIQDYLDMDNRFRVIDKVNTGYGHSMNLGIEQAAGDYVAIVESDDFIEPDMYERLIEKALECDAQIVKSNFNLYTDRGTKFRENLVGLPYDICFSSEQYIKVFGVHPSVWSSLYKRDFLNSYNIRFLETPGASYQDIDFAFKVWTNAKRIVLLKEGLLNYRVDNAASSIKNPSKLFCVCDEMEEISKYIYESDFLSIEWKDRLSKIENWVRFNEYVWNYGRLDPVFQPIFYNRVVSELRVLRNAPKDTELWNSQLIEQLEQWIDYPDEYNRLRCVNYEEAMISALNTVNSKWEMEGFWNALSSFEKIYIYGAGVYGQKVLEFLKKEKYEDKVKGFVVSNISDENKRNVSGKEVYALSELAEEDKHKSLYIAGVKLATQREVIKNMQTNGIKNIMSMSTRILQLIDIERYL